MPYGFLGNYLQMFGGQNDLLRLNGQRQPMGMMQPNNPYQRSNIGQGYGGNAGQGFGSNLPQQAPQGYTPYAPQMYRPPDQSIPQPYQGMPVGYQPHFGYNGPPTQNGSPVQGIQGGPAVGPWAPRLPTGGFTRG